MMPGEVRVLLFDVFGTVVDWRSSVIRQCSALGIEGVDWAAFADAWRGEYQPQLETVRSGSRPWVDLDVLHREALDGLLERFGVVGADPDEMTRFWHFLDPWPDSVAGLERLGERFALLPCSNGHVAMMRELAAYARLPWDRIAGAEIARAYKPDREVYLRSAELAGADVGETMMVAAHAGDLEAAAACGLRTAFVARPDEHGPGGRAEAPPPGTDVVAGDLLELAALLGAA